MTLILIFLVCFFTYKILMTIIAFCLLRLTLNQLLYSSIYVHHHILSHKSCVVGAVIVLTSHTCVVNRVLISQFLCGKVSIRPSKHATSLCHSGACQLTMSLRYLPASLYYSDARQLAVSQCLSPQRTPMRSSCLPSGRVS